MEFDINTQSVGTVNNRQTKHSLTLVTSPQLKTMGIKIVQLHAQWLKITIFSKLTPVPREIWE